MKGVAISADQFHMDIGGFARLLSRLSRGVATDRVEHGGVRGHDHFPETGALRCKGTTTWVCPGGGFAERWRSAVIALRLETERIQSTADELPMNVALANDQRARSCLLSLLRCHMDAFNDYTTALNCVQALLAEHGAGGR